MTWIAASLDASGGFKVEQLSSIRHESMARMIHQTSVLAPNQDSSAHETLGPSAPREAPLVCIERS